MKDEMRPTAEKGLHSEFSPSLPHLNILICSTLKSLCVFTSPSKQFPIQNYTSLENYALCPFAQFATSLSRLLGQNSIEIAKVSHHLYLLSSISNTPVVFRPLFQILRHSLEQDR